MLLAAVADLTGDAVSEIILGQDDVVNVFSGSDRRLLYSFVVPADEEVEHPRIESVVGTGDLNGDGIPDFGVGVEDFDKGRVHLFSGANGSLLRTLYSPVDDYPYSFGNAIASVGDMDGDGMNDIIVSAPDTDFLRGVIYVFCGRDGRLLRTMRSPHEQSLGSFGNSLAVVGDVNGDQVDDLVVGSQERANSVSAAGRVYLFSGADWEPLLEVISDTPEEGALFGEAVAGTADIDGDNWPDIIVGTPRQERVHVFSGATGQMLAKLTSPSSEEDEAFGSSVAGTEDVNGDGVPDLLVGAPRAAGGGRVYLFSGADGMMISVSREGRSEVPASLRIEAAYPNPFIDELAISYTLDHPGTAVLTVFDLTGRSLTTLFKGERSAGTYRARWSPENLPGGMYMIALRVNGRTVSHIVTRVR